MRGAAGQNYEGGGVIERKEKVWKTLEDLICFTFPSLDSCLVDFHKLYSLTGLRDGRIIGGQGRNHVAPIAIFRAASYD